MCEIMQSAQPRIDGRLANALADELVALTGRLASLSFELGSDAEVLRRHMQTLQSIDLITQTQLAIADVLRSEDRLEVRIAAVPLEDLADRLRRHLG